LTLQETEEMGNIHPALIVSVEGTAGVLEV
jgi:hypothetical protein